MILISHRGNINGAVPFLENRPDYIDYALEIGYDVEIDLWLKDEKIYLGHDDPQFRIDYDWIKDRSSHLWLHCKNIEFLEFVQFNDDNLNFFWHQEDTVTLTARGFIWAFPGKQPIKNSIAVMPEIFNDNTEKCLGICSDFISKYV